ncbi:uncharacterized protein [Henckelia pumila]|uniref:uncharacterized protein n=1 Tax=Henckelia pumila TaxID=405737 RepID=UPI003C6DE5F6
MTANSQQFGTNRSDSAPKRSNEVNISSLKQQLIDLTSLVRQLVVGNGQNVKKCGICAEVGHSTEMCPTLHEGSTEQVNAAGGFPGPPYINYDPYSNTYNPGWKDHSNLRYGNPSKTRASIQYLNTQVGQLVTAVNRSEAQNSSSLPSQTVPNPKENVSAITLRSGRELKVQEEVVQEPVKHEDEDKSKVGEDGIVQKNTPRGQHKLKGCKKIELGEQVSAVIWRKTPEKCKDLGMFSIPCKIGDVQLDTAMLDLGASINVMSYSVYASLKLRPLNETATVIQMADISTIYPRGVIDDVHVQVDVNNGTLTMEFDGNIVKFNIFDNLNFSSCKSVVNNLDINDYLSQEYKKIVNECKLKEVMARPAKISNARIFLSNLQASKTEPKLPPDRSKGITMGKRKKSSRDWNPQEIKAEKEKTEVNCNTVQMGEGGQGN